MRGHGDRQAQRRSRCEKGTAPALTAGEHDAWRSAVVLATAGKRRSTGSDCTSPDYRPARSADILRPSDTRSSTAYHRRPSPPPRTMERRSSLLPLAAGQRLKKQGRQSPEPCGSFLTSLVGARNNTELPVGIPRRQLRKSRSALLNKPTPPNRGHTPPMVGLPRKQASLSGDELQPLVLGEHLHAVLLGLGELRARTRTGDDIVGLLRDGAGRLGTQALGLGFCLLAR